MVSARQRHQRYYPDLVADGSGNLYVGGYFTSAGGVAANNIATWDGSAWSALGDGMGVDDCPLVAALAVDANGNLYAGGGFSTAGGIPASNIARWDGSIWSPLGSGIDGGVFSLVFDENGTLYAGGEFVTAGGKPSVNIAKWEAVSIAGTVTENGMPLRGVTVALDGAAQATATTGADGCFRFSSLASGEYIIAPAMSHYTFSP